MTGYDTKIVYLKEIENSEMHYNNIRFGCFINLPFRLRIGKSISLNGNWNGPFSIFFQNREEVGKDWDFQEFAKENRDWQKQLCTDVLIVLKKPDIESNYLDKFIKKNSIKDLENSLSSKNIIQANVILNQVLISYYTLQKSHLTMETKDFVGPKSFSVFNLTNFLEHMKCVLTIICESDLIINSDGKKVLFNAAEESSTFISNGMYGPYEDLPGEVFVNIGEVLEKQKRMFFYECIMLGNIYSSEQSYEEGLIWYVIALENVTSFYLKNKLELKNQKKRVDDMVKKLFTKLGISQILDMISIIWLDDFKDYDDNIFNGCKKGITIRNEIIHSIIKKSTVNYRERQLQDIRKGVDDIRQLTNIFVKHVENISK